MANDENLKPHEFTSEQSREEAARNGRKGGIASGESRRRNRTLRELAQIISEKKVKMPMPDGSIQDGCYLQGGVYAICKQQVIWQNKRTPNSNNRH